MRAYLQAHHMQAHDELVQCESGRGDVRMRAPPTRPGLCTQTRLNSYEPTCFSCSSSSSAALLGFPH